MIAHGAALGGEGNGGVIDPRVVLVRDSFVGMAMILDAMAESLAKGERIEIRGFGSFGLNYRPPRTGRNPKSGERVQVPEKHVPHFKAGKELRERVDFKELKKT